MNSSDTYLLSFELEQNGDTLFIHGDAVGLETLSELLLRLVDRTQQGHFDHEHLMTPAWAGQELSEQNKGGKVINHVKVYCWKGENRSGGPDHPLMSHWKKLEDHGYTLATVKEWRKGGVESGRANQIHHFRRLHGLGIESRAHGLVFLGT